MALFTEQTYHANGKLLLTGEYFVLDGALALALPTRLGQRLHIRPHSGIPLLSWRSLHPDGSPWFTGQFDLSTGQCSDSSDTAIAQRLEEILGAIRRQHPGFLSPTQAIEITTQLDFPRHWGLGSSSTLISTLAQWAGLDPFLLLADTFGGSGYDIACANASGPIIYQRRQGQVSFELAPFSPPFKDHLYFVYLGQKQNSREGISRYRRMVEDKVTLIDKISDWTQKIQTCQRFSDFCTLIDQHEALISEVLDLPRVQQIHFADFWGCVKSLGAWGGDFALICSDRSREETQAYCNEKGFDVFFSYNDLIL